MAYPYDGMFYPTLPQDTQDFNQVLSGVGRSLRDISRGISYYPYDLLGSGVDVANLALGAAGLGSERPVLGSDYLRNIARSLGMAQEPTGSATENITRLAAGLTNPMAGARAVGRVGDITTEQANRAADALVRQITGNPEATAPAVLEAAGQMAPLSRIFRPEQVKSVLPETKVVDEAGNPKMLYHGTNEEYEEFSESALGTKTGNPTSKIGFFFSESPSESSRYASDWGKEGGNVRPVYLDIKNPKRLTYKEMNDISMAMFDDSSSLPVNAWKTKEGQKAIVERKEKGIKRANQMAVDLRERLISEGYDGAVVKIGGMDEYIAFNPDQIKSAISDPSFAGLLDEPAQSVEKIYHGTSPQAAKQIEKAGFDITKSADGSVWFTNNPDIGEVSATGKGAVVERLADINKLKLGGWEETDKFSTNELIQKGFDGLRLVDGDTVTYQIFNPEKLKSPVSDKTFTGLLEPKTSKFEMPSFASLRPETTDDVDKIYDYLEKQAKKSGFRVESGASNVSNSRYLTIEKDLGNDEISTIEVRISAHGDRHPFTYATDGKISIDPSRGGVDLETTLWDLQEKGYDLIK